MLFRSKFSMPVTAFTRKAGDQARSQDYIRDPNLKLIYKLQQVFLRCPSAHLFKYIVIAVLDRQIKIMADLWLARNDIDQFVIYLLGITVKEPDPVYTVYQGQLVQKLRQTFLSVDIGAVERSLLRDQDQFAHALRREFPRRPEHLLQHAAAELHARRLAREVQRNRDAHLLRQRHLAEIHVDGSPGQHVVLQLTQKRVRGGPVHVQRDEKLLAAPSAHRHHELVGVQRDQLGAALEVDGQFGSKTEAAVKAFQKKTGLKQDGKYGDLTHAALMAAIADNDVGQKTEPDLDPEPEELTEARVKIVCNSGTVNIRVGNGTDYARITAVADGTTFEWIATASNGWHAVKVGSQVGWVSGAYAELE